MASPDQELLNSLRITEEDLEFLQNKGYGPDRLRRIAAILEDKLSAIPEGLFITNSTPSLGDVLHRGQRLVPSVPRDIGIAWFLRDRATIAQEGDIPKKRGQPLRITSAIFYWRLDENHQFQRYHDASRYNTAIYLALLVKDQQARDSTPQLDYDEVGTNNFQLGDNQKSYIVDYIQAMLEHHNSPAQFEKRDLFIAGWKRHTFDVYLFRGNMKRRVKTALRSVGSDWDVELEAQRMMVPGAAFEAPFGRFVGVMIPGDRAYRTQREHNNTEFGAATIQFENTPAPDRQYFTSLLAAMETPFDTTMIADVPAQQDFRHMCPIADAVQILESTSVSDILALLEDQFA